MRKQRSEKPGIQVWLALLAALALLMAACADDADDAAALDDEEDVEAGDADSDDEELRETRGPGGEDPTPSTDVVLEEDEVADLQDGDYTAAMLWHESSEFVNAVTRGIEETMDELDIDVIATTDAEFDSATQRSDVETVMAQQPDIVITLVVDPAAGAEAFREVTEAGSQLVLLSNVPDDYVHGEDYTGLVTDDLFAMGEQAAHALAEAIGEEGEIGYVFHDADYYVTNQRDDAFHTVITQDYPDIEIVEEEGIADPARTEEVANAMLTRNPDLDGIYATWEGPAEGVLAALRSEGRDDVAVVTLDLAEPVGLDMVQGGNVTALVADEAYELGRTLATVGAYGVLDKEAPDFAVVPAVTVTADNVVEGWQQSLGTDPPDSIMEAIGD